jgi:single-stranded DNA-binding protein
MDIKGKVHEVSPVQNVTETFKKRELVVEYAENPNYPEYIKFEVHQDKVNILDNYKPGDVVDVHFNLRGRPWTDRNGKTSYFNTLVCWKISKQDGSNVESAPQYTPPAEFSNTPQDDDLPF